MGNRKGRTKAQSITEMIADMTESKPCGSDADSPRENHLKEIIEGTLDDVAKLASRERVSLEDVEAVQRQTMLYLRACKETLTFPTSLGLARSLGYSDRALRHWRNNRSDTPTGEWLAMFNDVCSDVIGQVALKNTASEKFRELLESTGLGEINLQMSKEGKRND